MYRMNEKPFKFREMKRINADAKLRTEFDAKKSFFILTKKLKYILALHDAEHGTRTLNRYRNFWFSTKAVGVTFITTL